MNPKQFFLAASLLGGLLSAPVIATASVIPAVMDGSASFSPPAPVKVIAPTGLPRQYLGKTITLSFTIDETGQARDIQILKEKSHALLDSMTAAVSQWRFSPARRNGEAVTVRVNLPVELLGGES